MPTTIRLLTPAERERERQQHLAAQPETVAPIDTPAGTLRVERVGGGYRLRGDGLRLFGADPSFGEVELHAVDDADAVESAKKLIYSRWGSEWEQMRAAFWPTATASSEADPSPSAPAPHCDQSPAVPVRRESAGEQA